MAAGDQYIDCDNVHLTWKDLFNLLSAVSSQGCAAMRTIQSPGPTPGVSFELRADGGYELRTDGSKELKS